MRCNQIHDNDKDMDSKPVDLYTFLEAYNEAASAKGILPATERIKNEKNNNTMKNAFENAQNNLHNAMTRMSDRTFSLSDQKGIDSSDIGISKMFNGPTTSPASIVDHKDEPMCFLCKNADICKYREKFETLHKCVMECYDKEFKDIDPNRELFNVFIFCHHFNMMHSGVRTPLQY